MIGRNCISSLVLALLDWQQRKLSKKIDMWEEFAKELNKAQAAQLQAVFEERKMVLTEYLARWRYGLNSVILQFTIYYVVCRIVLEVLLLADDSENALSATAADELEKACFFFFEENKCVPFPNFYAKAAGSDLHHRALVLVKTKKGEKEDSSVLNRLHIYELFSQILGELCSQK